MSEEIEVESPEVEEVEVQPEVEAPVEGENSEIEEVEEQLENGEISPEEAKVMIKSLKLKVNGKELVEELPFEIDPEHMEYLQKKFQMAAAGQDGLRTAAESKKQLDNFMNKAKANPWEAFEELGLDPDEWAEQRIQQRIEEMQKSPEELERESLQKELAALKQEKEENEARVKEQEFARLQKEAEMEMNSTIEEAIESQTQLPKSPYIVKRMADAMLWALDNGFENAKAADIAPLVEKEIIKEYQQMVDEMPEQVLESFMGKKTMERLRKQRLGKINKAPEAKIEDVAKSPAEVKKPKRKMTMQEFMDRDLHKVK